MNLLLGQYQSLAGNNDGDGEIQSVLSSVKLSTTKEETCLLKKRKKKTKKKSWRALGVDHVLTLQPVIPSKCKKPRNKRFFRHQRREETSKTANDTPVVNLLSVDLTELENRVLSKGLRFCPHPKIYDRGNLLHDTMVFSRRMRLKSHFNNRDDTNCSSEKYPNFVPKDDLQPPKQDPDLETFISSMESDIALHKSSKPKHDTLTKSERSALYDLQNRQEIKLNPLTSVLRLVSWIEITTSQRLRDN